MAIHRPLSLGLRPGRLEAGVFSPIFDKQNGKYDRIIDQVAAKAKEVTGKMNDNKTTGQRSGDGHSNSLTDKLKGVLNQFQNPKK
ncbi:MULTISPECIES: hypothetical protein [unclassified Exiguobacterium]|uniref:hypothetical protein n=1 Tax=unclassified Exiguobacterium TaxID=2644629 RepID=UPI00103FE5F9|nr:MULTISPECIES: hypothetical protein [unclassified Exiguobacterium]TCI24118.1 hypothetical protein EVJ32_15415 [Exiguobacterium sp. SH5S4]TCI52097.1 hypothetical protein EVJ30_10015 [Exiguobacterium sp. SH5S13]TCI60775.1 hypothetical protein EVJ26_10895 [Exiguobacterium sp. SH3S1]